MAAGSGLRLAGVCAQRTPQVPASPAAEGPSWRGLDMHARTRTRRQVAPVARRVVLAGADGAVISEGRQHVICLQLEGRWMPLEDVSGELLCPTQRPARAAAAACPAAAARTPTPDAAHAWPAACTLPPVVDVAGKYRYAARDPAGGEPLPVLLDVLLVGRTKILKLHGPLWASNGTRHKLGITLAMPAAANGAARGGAEQFAGWQAEMGGVTACAVVAWTTPRRPTPPRRRACGARPWRCAGQPPEPAAAPAAAGGGALPAGSRVARRLAVPGALWVRLAKCTPRQAACLGTLHHNHSSLSSE